jgi:aspartate 1-decarboxylase
VILVTYAELDELEARSHRPRIVFVDQRNRPVSSADERSAAAC